MVRSLADRTCQLKALLLVPRAAGEGFRDCLCPARADAVRAEVEGPQALGMMKI